MLVPGADPAARNVITQAFWAGVLAASRRLDLSGKRLYADDRDSYRMLAHADAAHVLRADHAQAQVRPYTRD